MRRLLVGMVVAGLLSVGGSAVLASSDHLGQSDGRTIALPEAGISVTFPRGWRIEPPLVDPPPPSVGLLAASDLSADGTSCAVDLWEGASSPGAVFVESFTSLRENEQYEEMIREDVTLSVGVGLHVVWRFGDIIGPVHHYYVATPTGVARLGCRGAAPPLDAWLGIVESIDALPAGGAQAWTFEPRIEVPARGFAIDFPADWTVSGLDRTGGRGVLRAIQSLGATDRTGLGECWIEDHTDAGGTDGPQTIDDWLDERVEALAWMGQPVVTRVELPSGPIGHLDWPGELDTQTKWLFIEDGRRLLLACHAEQPPEDRWLSIAETFELLPDEK